MIRVEIFGGNKLLRGLKVEGHAESGPEGHDLVCAAVSAVITGTFNALHYPKKFDLVLSEGYASCLLKNDKEIDERDFEILRACIISLETISESNSQHIKIYRI